MSPISLLCHASTFHTTIKHPICSLRARKPILQFVDVLAKISELRHRLTARRSLGGLSADRAAVRSKEKRGRLVARSVSVTTATAAASPVSPMKHVFFFYSFAPSRDGKRIQITSQLEPGKLLASGMQQISVVEQTAEEELASCV